MEREASLPYQGGELSIFAAVTNWKHYWASSIQKWIAGDVLEVGAGMGANTRVLQTPAVASWHCLEPDANLCHELRNAVADLEYCSVACGTIGSLAGQRFDCVLYIDVLEHIEADGAELSRAARLLRPGGHLVVLSPAHPFLYSRFDTEIGHFRRYTRETLLACSPESCRIETVFYLDSLGLALSLANRLMLKQSMPTAGQLQFWDRSVIPASRLLDRAIRYRMGKSIVGVWTRLEDREPAQA